MFASADKLQQVVVTSQVLGRKVLLNSIERILVQKEYNEFNDFRFKCFSGRHKSSLAVPLTLAYIINIVFLNTHYQSCIFLTWSQHKP